MDEVYDNWSRFQFITDSVSDIQELRFYGDTGPWTWTAGLFWFREDQYTFLASAGDRGLFFQGNEFNQPNTDSSSASIYSDVTYHLTDITRLTVGLRFTEEEKSRIGVNARYAFALGGRNFSCCGGVRLGTEGFRFAARDRTIFDPDTNGDGSVSDEEYLAFYYDGIARFGARDNVEAIFAKGTYGGGATQEDRCPASTPRTRTTSTAHPTGSSVSSLSSIRTLPSRPSSARCRTTSWTGACASNTTLTARSATPWSRPAQVRGFQRHLQRRDRASGGADLRRGAGGRLRGGMEERV